MRKLTAILLALVATAAAHAATFNLFGPVTGILKGSASTYQTSAAVSADVRSLWSGTCNASTFLRGDGACAAAGSGSAAGSDTWVQFNDMGAFGADAAFTFDKSTKITALGGDLHIADTLPLALFDDTNASGDQRHFIVKHNNNNTCFATQLDSGSGGSCWLSVNQSAAVVTDISLTTGSAGTIFLDPGSASGIASIAQGLLLTSASTATSAGLRLPHGTAPTSPTNGDCWTTTAGLFCRINGSTVGPYSAGGGGSPGGSDTQVQYNNMGAFAGDAGLTYTVGSTLLTVAHETIEANSAYLTLYDANASANMHKAALYNDGTGGVAGLCSLSDAEIDPTTACSPGTRNPFVWTYDSSQNITSTQVYGGAGGVFIGNDAAATMLSDSSGNWTLENGSGVTINEFGTGIIFSAATLMGGTGGTVDMQPSTGTFVVTFDDTCTTSPTVTFNYYKIGPVVTIAPASTTGFPCTSDSTAYKGTGADVPAALRPSTTSVVSSPINGVAVNNTAEAPAFEINIDSSGHFILMHCGAATATDFTCLNNTWTNSGSKNFVISSERPSFTYYKH